MGLTDQNGWLFVVARRLQGVEELLSLLLPILVSPEQVCDYATMGLTEPTHLIMYNRFAIGIECVLPISCSCRERILVMWLWAADGGPSFMLSHSVFLCRLLLNP